MNPPTKKFKPGSHLFHENDRSRELYIIQSGNVRVYRTQNNREVELAVLGKGSVLGEMALIDGRPRSASARALDECTVSIIDADLFHSRVKGVPNWFMTIAKMTSQKIRNANRLLQSIGGGKHGINIILALYYQFCQYGERIDYAKTKRTLSRLLDTSEQNIVRICEFLATHGFVEYSGTGVRLADKIRLADYCDFLRLYLQKTFERSATPSHAVYELVLAISRTCLDAPDSEGSRATIAIEGEEFWDLISEINITKNHHEAVTFLEGNGMVTFKRKEGKTASNDDNPYAGITIMIAAAAVRQWSLFFTFNGIIPAL
ncbi:MAG: cyclic nucleotide-binding domain-containing protein [Chitinispirillaceae bacterium]|nr:cyclic nucleotide-binding domain-containing protein [Chitinispirillaceae bacterium]